MSKLYIYIAIFQFQVSVTNIFNLIFVIYLQKGKVGVTILIL